MKIRIFIIISMLQVSMAATASENDEIFNKFMKSKCNDVENLGHWKDVCKDTKSFSELKEKLKASQQQKYFACLGSAATPLMYTYTGGCLKFSEDLNKANDSIDDFFRSEKSKQPRKGDNVNIGGAGATG